jgi:hypothetical protein
MTLATQILIAVVTALATTVVVDFAAKPRLEARKARLIRARQSLDDYIAASVKLSMRAGMVPFPRQVTEPIMAAYRHRAVLALEPTLDELLNALAGLSIRWSIKHREHIGRTLRLWGNVAAFIELEKSGSPWDDQEFRKAVDLAAEADVYFLANVEFADPQQSLLSRWRWNRNSRKAYEERLDAGRNDETR